MTPGRPWAEQSSTLRYNGQWVYDCHRARDMDLATWSWIKPGSDGRYWIKIKYYQVHCIEQVKWYRCCSDGSPIRTWTCTEADCTSCQGDDCSVYSLTVLLETTSLDNLQLSPHSNNCRYGDTVKLEGLDSVPFAVSEIASFGVKQGEGY